MPSRLEKLCGNLSYEQYLHEPSINISTDDLEDLLAVVESAKDYIAECDAPVPDLNLRVVYRARLRTAIAKLNEVQQ